MHESACHLLRLHAGLRQTALRTVPADLGAHAGGQQALLQLLYDGLRLGALDAHMVAQLVWALLALALRGPRPTPLVTPRSWGLPRTTTHHCCGVAITLEDNSVVLGSYLHTELAYGLGGSDGGRAVPALVQLGRPLAVRLGRVPARLKEDLRAH